MMTNNPFGAICRTLESLTLFRGTAADWVRWLAGRLESPEDAFALLRRAFLQKEAAPATHVFCAHCQCQHEVLVCTSARSRAARVELYPAGHPALSVPAIPPASTSITALCRCGDQSGCPDIELEQADLEVWRVNWARFGRELCRAFELAGQFAELPVRNTWQIGSWSSEAVPVVLTIQPDRGRLRSALVELIARLRERFIVFGPTARQVEAACWELLSSANAAYFPLEGNVMLTHNATLQPARSPGELFRKFTPQPGEADLSEAQRIFALVQQLEAESRNKLPSVLTVFRLYCLEQLKVDQIADRCRCAKGTISHRLQ